MTRFEDPRLCSYRNRTLLAVAATVLLTAGASIVRGQERTTLRKVEIHGLQRFSRDQVMVTSGLKVGDLIDASAIDAAAERLQRSGWFTSVEYRVETADSDTTVIFEVVEKARPTGRETGDALGHVVWSGNNVLSSQELSTAFALRAGDPAPRSKIDSGLEAVRKAYRRRGYIDAQIAETSTGDAATRRVNYQFTIREGPQFRMGELTIAGLNGIDTRHLRGNWTVAPNAVFDDSYVEQFNTTVIRPFIANRAQRTGGRLKFDVSTKPDIQKQTVDVIITFK